MKYLAGGRIPKPGPAEKRFRACSKREDGLTIKGFGSLVGLYTVFAHANDYPSMEFTAYPGLPTGVGSHATIGAGPVPFPRFSVAAVEAALIPLERATLSFRTLHVRRRDAHHAKSIPTL